MFTCVNSQSAWEYLQAGRARFVIADRTNTDMDEKHFIEHVRLGSLPTPVYILLITNSAYDPEIQPAQADDYLFKPITAAELNSRVTIGERILCLGDDLFQAKDQLESLALFDPLTGLLNQIAFLSTAVSEVERARRSQLPLSVIVLDIDNFKALNDQHGKRVGDGVLKLVAQVIREKSRPYDCIGRWNGDEFISILPGMVGSDAEKVAGRIIKGARSMQITVRRDGLPLKVEMSAGVAVVVHIGPSVELEDLVQKARTSMLRAKEAGGNQVYLAYV